MTQEPAATHNQFAYSVSEISQALKRVVEDNFGQVRVRGEISGWKAAASGHGYLKLKDEGAVLDAVCWKGVLARMKIKPEDGMEVVCTGKLTTYPGRSNYQLVIDFMEPTGAGALMALLEKRKAMLAAEGLFAPERKRPLPFMPRVIGVVTSPTGAVIRDILHRLSDRFPCHVLVWPVLVQGEGAAAQIAAAIEGFNAIGKRKEGNEELEKRQNSESAIPQFLNSSILHSSIPRPDLLIVARGGGSLEDLWAFNEEIVVRAAAASKIPLISAVGHETDTTLIDFASDRRAPTPTAAAEIAVPVLSEWLFAVLEHGKRLHACTLRLLENRQETVMGLARGLPQPLRLLENATQRFDDWSERFHASLPAMVAQKGQQLLIAGVKLEPRNLLRGLMRHSEDVQGFSERMNRLLQRSLADRGQMLQSAGTKLHPGNLMQGLERHAKDVKAFNDRLQGIIRGIIAWHENRLVNLNQLLKHVDYRTVLERGFALVKAPDGKVVTRSAKMKKGAHTLVFYDGEKKITT